MSIKRLDWDSNFFGYEVGEIGKDSDFSESENYHLIVLKQKREEEIEIEGFIKSFQETKVVFNKKLEKNSLKLFKNSIIDFDDEVIDKEFLYSLAFESGKFSRFRLDSNFPKHKFELLYTKWVDNSINKQFADKIFYVKEIDDIVGFVTLKNNNKFSTIGLIAVSENYQGRGLGKKLLLRVEEYCISQNIFEVKIPTQKENKAACHFYNKMGYNINEELIIKHYWNKKSH